MQELSTIMIQKEKLSNKKRVPAYILVGFLGSGKTTVLSGLIEWALDNGLKPALVVNEFGEVSIDGEAMRAEGLPMTEVTDGCICCTAGEDLGPAIAELAQQQDIDLILVEATGLADPMDMLDTLTDPELWNVVEVGGIISVVDAARFINLADDLQLARRQVQYADVLMINKCDLVDAEWKQVLKDTLPKIAPQARIFTAEQGIPEQDIADILAQTLEIGRQRLQPQRTAPEHSEDEHHEVHDDHDHDHHDHHHGEAHESIHTSSYSLERPLVRAKFEELLHTLPPTIYRAKGFVTFEADGPIYIFQYLPGFVFVKEFPLQERDRLRGVFIGRDLDKVWIAQQLDACLRQ